MAFRVVVFYSALILPLIIVGPISASHIIFETTVKTKFDKVTTHRFSDALPQESETSVDRLKVIVRIKNTGNETAFGVAPTIILSEADIMIGEGKNLPVGQDYTWHNTFDFETLGTDFPGSYALPMLILFKDVNGHPFSIPTIHRFNRGKDSSGRIAIRPKAPTVELHGRTTTSIILQNTGSVGKSLNILVLHPKEIASSIKSKRVLLPPNARKEVQIQFENVRALQETTVTIHYIVQYENEGMHYCEVASNKLLVSGRKGFNSLLTNRWIFLLAIVIVICVYTFLVWKRKNKN